MRATLLEDALTDASAPAPSSPAAPYAHKEFQPIPSPLIITTGHRPDLDLLVAAAADRRSARYLEQAGFVRDDALDLHRPRRNTSASTAVRQLRDAVDLLTGADYGVTRIYSEAEQRARAENRPSWIEQAPAHTASGKSAWSDLVTADIYNGHLVVLAAHDAPYSRELLGYYPATGEAATFYTESSGGRRPHYGIGRHLDLATALAAWESCGYASRPPLVGPRRSAALALSPVLPARTASGQPQAAAPVSAAPTAATRAAPPR
ncbi:hypothetical protein ABH940_005586 [Streptacidiphilus sp. BW17]|uniref:hypothetical protein n=1 Tax=Streptacidiphilus sp. BW17 TaxID=3156274 RepID=UPI003512F1DE